MATAQPGTGVLDGALRDSVIGFALVDLRGHCLDVNTVAAARLGWPAPALAGVPLAGLCEAEDALALATTLADPAPGTEVAVRVAGADGQPRDLRIGASRVRDADGRDTARLLTVTGGRAAQQAEEELDAFFALAPDLLAVASETGRFERVNPAWTAVLGWTAEEMCGRPFMDFVHPDDRERTLAEAVRTFGGDPGARFRNRYRTRSGGWRWLEWQTRPARAGRVHCVARDVTEQQQALIIFEAEMQRRRQSLEEAEQRLLVHVNNTPLAVIEFDERLRVRRWSTRAEQVFGWSEEEVVGDRPDQWRFIHEDDADAVATAMLSLVTGESPSLVIENRNHTRDGGVVHCEWFMSAVFDESGGLLSVLAFAQDVTARVAAQAQAEEREALFRATFEQAPVGVAHVGLDGRWLRVNGTLCGFLGHSPAALMRLTFQDITHPDDLDADLQLLQRLLDGAIDRYAMRKRYLHRDGSVRWAHLTVSLRRDGDGRPLHFISVIEDIAAQIEAEQALQAARDELEGRVVERTRELESANRTLAMEVEQRRGAEAALRESELRIRSILENSYDAFVAADEDGHIVEWNRAAEAIFGWRRAEAIGRPLAPLVLAPSALAAHGAAIARLMAGDDARLLDQRLQLPARHRSGHEFPAELTLSLVRLGRRRLLTAFLHDISERVAAEKQLRDSEARLRTITDNAPALIAHVGPDLRYRFANRAFREWFGQDPDALAGCHLADTMSVEAWRQIEPHVRRARAGARVAFEEQQVGPDGGVRHAHAVYVPDPAPGQRGDHGFFLMVHDITAHKQLAQVLAQRALRDELTGLPNRAALAEVLDAGRHDTGDAARPDAVLFLDLDGFKQVNDVHGHDAGDRVLREFAARLRSSVAEADVVARLAGDEFVIVLHDRDDPAAAAEAVARTIQAAMARGFEIGGRQVGLASSIGIALRGDGDRGDLLRRADAAMYAAKRAGVGRYAVADA